MKTIVMDSANKYLVVALSLIHIQMCIRDSRNGLSRTSQPSISNFFFYAILSTNSNSHSKYSFNKYSLCIIACDEYGSFYCLSVYSFLSNNTFFISSITYSKKKRKSLYDPYIFFYRDVYYHYKNIQYFICYHIYRAFFRLSSDRNQTSIESFFFYCLL